MIEAPEFQRLAKDGHSYLWCVDIAISKQAKLQKSTAVQLGQGIEAIQLKEENVFIKVWD